MRRGAAWFGLLAAACTVSPPEVLDEGFFACEVADDCGPGQGCAEGNVYSSDFCRPACDPDDPASCANGVCTAAGACLERCLIEADGTATGCAGPDFTCVRTDAIRDVGVCYPVEGCSRTADCQSEADAICLNDALGLPTSTTGLRFDNLYCTATPDSEGRCAQGYLAFEFADPDGGRDRDGRPRTTTVCYPPCDPSGGEPFCPPSTTCFRGFGELVDSPSMPPCLPGVWGLPCEDDTQCLLGRCLNIGDGRRACTETCGDAERLVGNCGGLARFSEALGVGTRMECGQVEGAEVCVPRFELLSLCDENLGCVGGEETECAPVETAAGTTVHVCVRFCVEAADCAGPLGDPDDYRCLDTAGPTGVCMARRGLGSRCEDDLDCREGVCCDVGEFSACQREC